MSVEVVIIFKDTYFYFSIMGDFLGIFRASLEVEASYGNVATLHARVRIDYFPGKSIDNGNLRGHSKSMSP